jgi:hypothetical protein
MLPAVEANAGPLPITAKLKMTQAYQRLNVITDTAIADPNNRDNVPPAPFVMNDPALILGHIKTAIMYYGSIASEDIAWAFKKATSYMTATQPMLGVADEIPAGNIPSAITGYMEMGKMYWPRDNTSIMPVYPFTVQQYAGSDAT